MIGRQSVDSTRTPARDALGRFAPVLILITVWVAFANGLNGPFVFDDLPNIAANRTIRDLTDVRQLVSPPPAAGIGGRPLVNVTLAINYALSELDPRGYKLFNLVVHWATAWLLFAVIRRTLRSPQLRGRWGAPAGGLALAATLVWVSHPIQTQAVTYVIQRCESLMGFFFLLSLYCAIRGWDAPPPDPGPVRLWHGLAIAAFLAGVFTKEVIAAAPFVLLAYDRLFVHRDWRALWRSSKLLYGGLAAALGLLAVHILTVSLRLPDRADLPFTPYTYALTQTQVLLHYLRLAVWPTNLVLDYRWPAATFSEALPAAIVLALLLAVGAWFVWRGRPAAFPALWFFLILAPTSSVLPIRDAAFEQRMYLPLAAPVVLAVLGGHVATRSIARRWSGLSRSGLLLLAAVVIALAIQTRVRTGDYRSALTIWSDTVTKRPENVRAHVSLAVALQEAGRSREAYKHLRIAERLEPDYMNGRINLGLFLLNTGRPAEAIAPLEYVIGKEPGNAEARMNLGIAYVQTGRQADGLAQLREAVRLAPAHAGARFNLALALIEQGAADEARAQLETVLRLEPRNRPARELYESLRRPR